MELKLRWQDAADLPTLYANQVYITHAGGEFYVVFGEVQLPILVNPSPDELDRVREVAVKPVAKLVLTPEGISSVVRAMAENIRRFEQRKDQVKKEGAE
jgi:hypothetical protein